MISTLPHIAELDEESATNTNADAKQSGDEEEDDDDSQVSSKFQMMRRRSSLELMTDKIRRTSSLDIVSSPSLSSLKTESDSSSNLYRNRRQSQDSSGRARGVIRSIHSLLSLQHEAENHVDALHAFEKKSTESKDESDLEDEEYIIDTLDMQRVEMSVSCSLLRTTPVRQINTVCVCFLKNEFDEWVENGRTEVIKDRISPDFQTSFAMDFSPYKKIKFTIYESDTTEFPTDTCPFFGSYESTMLDIVAKPDAHTFHRISSHKGPSNWEGYFSVLGFLVRTIVRFRIRGADFIKLDQFSESDPFFVLSRATDTNPLQESDWKPIYQSEVIMDEPNPVFQPVELSLSSLFGAHSFNSELMITFYDWDAEVNTFLGSVKFTLADVLLHKKRTFTMANIYSSIPRTHSGKVFFDDFKIFDLDVSIPGQEQSDVSTPKNHRTISLKRMGSSFRSSNDVVDIWSKPVFEILQQLTIICSSPLKDAPESSLAQVRSLVKRLISMALPHELVRTRISEMHGASVLVKLLRAPCPVIYTSVSYFIKYLACTQELRSSLTKAGALPCLVSLLYRDLESDSAIQVVWAIAHLVRDEPVNKVAVKDLGVFPPLIGFLSDSNTRLQDMSCWAISSILHGEKSIKVVFRDLGGLDELMRLISTRNPKLQLSVLRSLTNACDGCEENRKALCELGIMGSIVDFLNGSDESLVCNTLRLIGVLCHGNAQIREQLREFHCIKPLLQAISNCSKATKVVGIQALTNAIYADELNKTEMIKHHGVTLLVALSDDPDLRNHIISALRNTCSSESNRRVVVAECNEQLKREVFHLR
eukprot:TRINITY_DN3308_c0_g1_i6.p1 TRINITY_DN3308_c0_g1~~TRINITY_DN3308_c0_g1_i6.p1  ORF type:complete len:817 (-),score=153.62 TRINITY_DN3308_c0_g1_i6:147-2597(-)